MTNEIHPLTGQEIRIEMRTRSLPAKSFLRSEAASIGLELYPMVQGIMEYTSRLLLYLKAPLLKLTYIR